MPIFSPERSICRNFAAVVGISEGVQQLWGSPWGQTMAVNVKFAGLFKLMCPIDGPCRSESESTFNLKIPAGFLEKSTFKKNVTLAKYLSRKIFPLKFFIGSNERGGQKKSKSVQDSL